MITIIIWTHHRHLNSNYRVNDSRLNATKSDFPCKKMNMNFGKNNPDFNFERTGLFFSYTYWECIGPSNKALRLERDYGTSLSSICNASWFLPNSIMFFFLKFFLIVIFRFKFTSLEKQTLNLFDNILFLFFLH